MLLQPYTTLAGDAILQIDRESKNRQTSFTIDSGKFLSAMILNNLDLQKSKVQKTNKLECDI